MIKTNVKFKSKEPPIKSIKPLLLDIENWFNFLIRKKNFHVPTSEGEIETKLERFHVGYLIQSLYKTKTIDDVCIRSITWKNSIEKCPYRFILNISLGVTWRKKYPYRYGDEEYLKKKYNFKDDELIHISDYPEVPMPLFYGIFELSEIKKYKRTTDLGKFYEESLFSQQRGHGFWYDYFEKKDDNFIDNFESLKNFYDNNLFEVNSILQNYEMTIEDLTNKSHFINREFDIMARKPNIP